MTVQFEPLVYLKASLASQSMKYTGFWLTVSCSDEAYAKLAVDVLSELRLRYQYEADHGKIEHYDFQLQFHPDPVSKNIHETQVLFPSKVQTEDKISVMKSLNNVRSEQFHLPRRLRATVVLPVLQHMAGLGWKLRNCTDLGLYYFQK
uniref:Uncharacterized protein n=1 Tax=Paramoeba aestuarina TaxID=180227 RepID=A0A7S4PHX3_9EUKA|mmetsp:Transcript_6430/g.9708  ORF Transcript_6430/g.9708 Transcript_6430/m.9708 type:complete len:148 (+) Transcript_6430:68-511(+)